jgi:hypothetical protein
MTDAAGKSSSPDGLRPLAMLALGRTEADIEWLIREVRRKLRREGRAMTWPIWKPRCATDRRRCPTTCADARACMRQVTRWSIR